MTARGVPPPAAADPDDRRARGHGAPRADASPTRAATCSTCDGCCAARCAPAATSSTGPYRARKDVPRKLVVLCDVSGSMDSYSRALLLFLHAAVGSGRGVEAFAFGTRLSRLTPDLATRDPEAAHRAVHRGGASTGAPGRGSARR